MTCTFKNDTAPTGLARVGFRQGCVIKQRKIAVGRIDPPNHWVKETKYRIRLKVKKTESWDWVTLTASFDSLDSAKKFCKENWDKIVQKFSLVTE